MRMSGMLYSFIASLSSPRPAAQPTLEPAPAVRYGEVTQVKITPSSNDYGTKLTVHEQFLLDNSTTQHLQPVSPMEDFQFPWWMREREIGTHPTIFEICNAKALDMKKLCRAAASLQWENEFGGGEVRKKHITNMRMTNQEDWKPISLTGLTHFQSFHDFHLRLQHGAFWQMAK